MDEGVPVESGVLELPPGARVLVAPGLWVHSLGDNV
jgi:hypothetical protein